MNRSPVSDQVHIVADSFAYESDMSLGTEVKPRMEFTLKRIGLIVDVLDAATGELLEEAYVVFVQHGAARSVRVPVNAALFASHRSRSQSGCENR